MFLILCAPPLLVFLYYMKSADVMLLCCYASDLVIKYRNFMAQSKLFSLSACNSKNFLYLCTKLGKPCKYDTRE